MLRVRILIRIYVLNWWKFGLWMGMRLADLLRLHPGNALLQLGHASVQVLRVHTVCFELRQSLLDPVSVVLLRDALVPQAEVEMRRIFEHFFERQVRKASQKQTSAVHGHFGMLVSHVLTVQDARDVELLDGFLSQAELLHSLLRVELRHEDQAYVVVDTHLALCVEDVELIDNILLE